jgi:hypothetical protein
VTGPDPCAEQQREVDRLQNTIDNFDPAEYPDPEAAEDAKQALQAQLSKAQAALAVCRGGVMADQGVFQGPSDGPAVIATGGNPNGDGVKATAVGTGRGLVATGGDAGGPGVDATANQSGSGVVTRGGDQNGAGLQAFGGGQGKGLIANGGPGGGAGVEARGSGTRQGLWAKGGQDGGVGVEAIGGDFGGPGVRARAHAGDAHGLEAYGTGAGRGVYAEGGPGGGPIGGAGVEAKGGPGNAGVIATGGTGAAGVEAVGGDTATAGVIGTCKSTGAGVEGRGIVPGAKGGSFSSFNGSAQIHLTPHQPLAGDDPNGHIAGAPGDLLALQTSTGNVTLWFCSTGAAGSAVWKLIVG